MINSLDYFSGNFTLIEEEIYKVLIFFTLLLIDIFFRELEEKFPFALIWYFMQNIIVCIFNDVW